MLSRENLPDLSLTASGPISCCFIEKGARTFQQVCSLVQAMPYGDNTIESDDALFLDGQGTCISKHRAVAVCAAEQALPVFQEYGIYPLDSTIVEGLEPILSHFGIPFVPAGHCYLACGNVRVDLTEGNSNGKQVPVDSFLATVRLFSDDPVIKKRVYEMAVSNILEFDCRFSGISRETLAEAREICTQQMYCRRCAG